MIMPFPNLEYAVALRLLMQVIESRMAQKSQRIERDSQTRKDLHVDHAHHNTWRIHEWDVAVAVAANLEGIISRWVAACHSGTRVLVSIAGSITPSGSQTGELPRQESVHLPRASAVVDARRGASASP